MGRWTVVDGDQEVTIETTCDGRIRLCITSGLFEADANAFEDLRRKLGAAIGAARSDTQT